MKVESQSRDLRFHDAHNHLQDERFGGRQDEIVREAMRVGVHRMVVNGSCEQDWADVARLAQRFPCVIPSFGCHPWYVSSRTPEWERRLLECLSVPGCALGEIGLDYWKEGLDRVAQEAVFIAQWRMGVERNLPLSIHCLKAWGRLEEILRREPRSSRGFLLHSYGGSAQMIPPLAKLGAFFSFPGYFLHSRKARQAATFRQVPQDRLLVETDAPDQLPPESAIEFPLGGEGSEPQLNHPANLRRIYQGLAMTLGCPVEDLSHRVEKNFIALFGD